MSVAGGLSKAVERAVVHGCEALQIFTKNANRWVAPPLDPAEARAFRRRIDETGIAPVVSHGSYLINLATTSPALRAQSLTAFLDELDRAEALGLLGVVLHPGTCTAGTEASVSEIARAERGVGAGGAPARERVGGSAGATPPGNLEDAFRLIASCVRAAFKARPRRKTMVLFEHTAGQGRTVGHRFEHLAAILEHLDGSPRVGVCLDTCHLIASGYDIVSETGYRDTFAEFDRVVGLGRLKVFHGNDSKRPCGSRVDRHEHIGEGCLGLEPFRRLLHDPRFADLPLLIETEKSPGPSRPGAVVPDPLDMKNLGTLKRLRDEKTARGSFL
jgi:deoxyribonuclease-4